jgi:hypothetical protein
MRLVLKRVSLGLVLVVSASMCCYCPILGAGPRLPKYAAHRTLA